MRMQANLTQREREVLRRARNQKKYVAQLRQRAQRLPVRGGYRSPELTGMPRSGALPCGLDGSAQENEAELARLCEAEAALTALQARAEQIVGGLDWRLSVFARLYYVEALEVPEIAQRLERDDSTCWRYLRAMRGLGA